MPVKLAAPKITPGAQVFQALRLDKQASRRYNKQDDPSAGQVVYIGKKIRQRGDAGFLAAMLFWRGG